MFASYRKNQAFLKVRRNKILYNTVKHSQVTLKQLHTKRTSWGKETKKNKNEKNDDEKLSRSLQTHELHVWR